jgi:beta-glucosidase/6-phospho-beta-glucosidase/beta-galactosidase
MKDSKYKFLWGVATSSYQVEGGISNNDWDYFRALIILREEYPL